MSLTVVLSAALFGTMAAPGSSADSLKYWVFYGTNGQGVYRGTFDPATGELGKPELAAAVGNPSFLAIHPNRKFLYAVGEGNPGKVHAFALDAKTGVLTKLNEQSAGGAGPCHVGLDPAGKCVLVANYSGGSCGALPVKEDGSLGPMASFHQHKGSSVNPARQKGPHAHSANVSADGKFAVVADLGLDQLLVFKLDAAAAKLTPNDPPFFATPPGSGPRHFAFHPNGKFAYACGELDSTVIAMTYDAEKGSFTQVGVQSTLPDAKPVKGNSTAEVQVHPNGTHVFVSNRGHNSIAVFKVDPATGGLTPAGHLAGGINIPRNFSIDPTGKWVVVANQDGDSVVVFSWDDAAGTGKPAGAKVEVGKPVCVKFVPVAK